MVSLRVRKRFPTMEHVVKAGLITEAEAKLMEKPNAGYSGNKWWMPLVWATKIVDMVRIAGDRNTVFCGYSDTLGD